MFKLFGRKSKGIQPNTFKMQFAGGFIPMMLSEARANFLGTLSSEQGAAILAESWTKLAKEHASAADRVPPAGLQPHVFRDENCLIAAFEMPQPAVDGEPLFTAAVVGPTEESEWTDDVIQRAPMRYFIALRTSEETMEIGEQIGDASKVHGQGPAPEFNLFIEWVMNEAVRSDHVTSIQSDDEAMHAAIAKAKESLPGVLERLRVEGLENFSVKVPITDDHGTEHFWLSNTEFVEGVFKGILDADPRVVECVTPSQAHEAKVEDVTDWLFLEEGKMRGNFTLRALLPHMTPAEAAKYANVLAEED